jgi:hypothetical protein
VIGVTACAPEIAFDASLEYANVRVPQQTAPERILVFSTDIDQPYDVLADLEVTVRQQTAFGELPTKTLATRALREQAGRIGAQALILVNFGTMGMSWWSYNELRGHGRAIRFR